MCRYKQREAIKAIVHTHSPTILAYAISHSKPNAQMSSSVFQMLGEISNVPYCICGGNDLVTPRHIILTNRPMRAVK